MNFEPRSGSDNRSVLSAHNATIRFKELIVVSEFLTLSTALLIISPMPFN